MNIIKYMLSVVVYNVYMMCIQDAYKMYARCMQDVYNTTLLCMKLYAVQINR